MWILYVLCNLAMPPSWFTPWVKTLCSQVLFAKHIGRCCMHVKVFYNWFWSLFKKKANELNGWLLQTEINPLLRRRNCPQIALFLVQHCPGKITLTLLFDEIKLTWTSCQSWQLSRQLFESVLQEMRNASGSINHRFGSNQWKRNSRMILNYW